MKVAGEIKTGAMQEIVAELSAQALCLLEGKQPNKTMENNYRYIDHYAQRLKLSPFHPTLPALNCLEKQRKSYSSF
jgi:hypothetical protein